MADPAGATNYIPITADHTKLAASMPDAGNTFGPAPIIIDQAAAVNYEGGAATFIDGLLANCTDLKVTDPTGAINVPFGINQFSQVAGSRKLILGLGIPSTAPLLSSADTIYRLYRGCTGGTFENRAGVVPTADGFLQYLALEESSGTFQDWTTADNDGTAQGAVTYGATGQVGNAVSLPGGVVYISTPVTTALTNFTAMAWFKFTGATPAYHRILDKHYAEGFWIGGPAANTWGGGVREPGPPYGRFVTLADGALHHIASVRDGTTHTIYGDGGAVTASGTVTADAMSTVAMRIGDQVQGNAGFVGILDEVQIASVARSANWITSYYNMTSANGTFWTVGAEVALGGGLPIIGGRAFGRSGPSLAGMR